MNPALTSSIQSTAGAVPVKNEKGEISMQKVKVHRYVSGKRPDYAPLSSSEEDEDEDFIEVKRMRLGRANSPVENEPAVTEIEEEKLDDPRLRRLRSRFEPSEESRHIHEPEVVETRRREREASSDSDQGPPAGSDAGSDVEEGDDLSDSEIERRRIELRTRVLRRQETQNDDVLACEEEGRSPEASSASSSSDYEEYSDSEGEEVGPRLKPVFVRRRDRVTVLEREKEALKAKASEIEARRLAEEKRKQALRLVEEEIRKDSIAARAAALGGEAQLDDVDTDTDNDEADYDAWKARELFRVRRDREERENVEKERREIERLRGLTEEERRAEMRSNPRQITNKASKGKYKFLQKYYHRGAFYMDNDQDLLRRDFSAATLEDHFDKTVLPKVMQVKNFGRSGRTKYTHLVDQDTTHFDSPCETAQNLKFATIQAAGMKQVFDRPSQAKRKLP